MTIQCRTIAVLGSTGSIGEQTLDVVRRNPGRFKVAALSAGARVEKLIAQALEFRPELVCIADENAASSCAAALAGVCRVESGAAAAEIAALLPGVEIVVAGIVGFACLRPVLAAIGAGKHLALANKESLVAGGALVQAAIKLSKSVVVPVDSEHSSIFQCLRAQEGNPLRRIMLTASGGPFLHTPKDELAGITPEAAVRHPRWDMGAKISVDSATLMNKGLEVIEAARLFNLPADKIDVLIHPQSLVHGMIEYEDRTVSAILYEPDMRLPISYALGFLAGHDPGRCAGGRINDNGGTLLDLAKRGKLEFFAPDTERFPCLKYAYEALSAGGSLPIVLNAANEIAVHLFLKRELRFIDIAGVVRAALDSWQYSEATTVDEVFEFDRLARRIAEKCAERFRARDL